MPTIFYASHSRRELVISAKDEKKQDNKVKAPRKARRKPVAPSADVREGAFVNGFDEHDEAIIAHLREDGRISNRELASKIGLNEATVRSRIRKLEESDTMRVVAMVDLGAAGFSFSAPVGIQVKGRLVEDVGKDLAQIPQVVTVSVALGAHDLELQVVARSLEDLNELISKRIPSISGVSRIDAALAMDIIKYESPWVPFT